MYQRLEQIDISRNRWRWYALSVQPTLFGEWAFIREWGRLGQRGGQTLTAIYSLENDAFDALDTVRAMKTRRGYALRPAQLELPF